MKTKEQLELFMKATIVSRSSELDELRHDLISNSLADLEMRGMIKGFIGVAKFYELSDSFLKELHDIDNVLTVNSVLRCLDNM